jgi:hypothetical protein
VTDERQARREALLARLRRGYVERVAGDRLVADYDAAVGESLRLSGGDFMKAFQLGAEPESLRAAYGSEPPAA